MLKLVKTHLSQRPAKNAAVNVGLSILLMSIFSTLSWSYENFRATTIANWNTTYSEGQLYRLWTSMFIHSDLAHFLSNSYMFIILGFLACGYFGVIVFLCLFLVLGPLVHFITLATYPPDVHLVGVSGAVYVLAGFWLSMFVFIERRHSIAARFVRAIGVGLAILFPTSFEPNVSYRAHAIGFALGILTGAIYFYHRKDHFRRAEIYEIEDPTDDGISTN